MSSTETWVWGFLFFVFVICFGSLFYIYWLFKWTMNHSEGPDEMKNVSDPIREGAFGFLKTQYTAIALFAVPVAIIIFCIYVFVPGSTAGIITVNGETFPQWMMATISSVAFLLGAFCSGLSGYFGMWVSVRTNVRCAAAAIISSNEAIKVALRGGAFSGMLIVTLSLFGVGSMFGLVHGLFPNVDLSCLSNVIVGYGFGASFVALFAQLGGGIYTKAADVGSDLVGKVNNDIPEDDPRNPATIADLVGDNVGDCAGRGADLFESTAAENIGAMVIGGAIATQHNFTGLSLAGYILFPLIVRSFGLLSSMVGIVCVYSKEPTPSKAPASNTENNASFGKYTSVESLDEVGEDPLYGLIRGFIVTVGLCTVSIFLVSWVCLDVDVPGGEWAWALFGLCGTVGITISLLFVFITEYYTDYRFRPVHSIAQASQTGHATNIIAGLAVGMESTCLPVLVISAALVTCYYLGEAALEHAGFFGTACGTMGMLMVVAFVLAMDTFGPISDNAGGIVEMSQQPEHIRVKTDRLDAVGNTTKALTKGYAVGSAALATFLLFSAFLDTVKLLVGDINTDIIVDLGTPEVFCGGLIGGMVVYLFSAWAIEAVGVAAQKIIGEVTKQFAEHPGIMNYTEKPDYQHCVTIVTQAALHEMIKPALLIICSPIVLGLTFRIVGWSHDTVLGARVLGAMLMIATATGILCGLFLNNAGGAWDNAKKYIEMGNYGGKGSETHKAAVTGDTVGDPSKDTAGPSIHVLIKLLSTITLVLAPIFVKPKTA